MNPMLVERLGWVLVHSWWQFAAVAAVASVAVRVLRQGSAAARYGVLVGAMGLMVAGPVATWGWQQANEREIGDGSSITAVSERGVRPEDDAVRVPADDVVLPSRQDVSPAPALVADAVVVPQSVDETPRVEVVSTAGPSLLERTTAALRPWLAWIVATWSVGVMLCSARPLFGWYTLRRLKRVGVSPVSNEVLAALGRVSKQLGLQHSARLLQSTLAQVPIVVGYFRPVILLPVTLVTSIPAAQLEAILAHELAHVRRHDFAVNLLQTLVETLFFYHPAVWWLSRRIRVEREHCCDDLVVRVLGNRVEYGRALVAIEQLRGRSTVLALGANDGSLLSRVRRIVGLKSDQGVRSPWSLLSLVACCLAVVLAIGVFNFRGSAQAGNDSQELPSENLDFLKSYSKLQGLSLDVTEARFKAIVRAEQLAVQFTPSDGGKSRYAIPTGDEHHVVVTFDNGKCSGIQRIRGENGPRNVTFDSLSVTFKNSFGTRQVEQIEIKANGDCLYHIAELPARGTIAKQPEARLTSKVDPQRMLEIERLLAETNWLTRDRSEPKPPPLHSSEAPLTVVRGGVATTAKCFAPRADSYRSLLWLLRGIATQEHFIYTLDWVGDNATNRKSALIEIRFGIEALEERPGRGLPQFDFDYRRLLPTFSRMLRNPSEDEDEVLTAIKVATIVRSADDFEFISRLKHDRNSNVRNTVAIAITDFGGERAVPLLAEMVSSSEEARWGLVRLGDLAVPALVKLIEPGTSGNDIVAEQMVRAYLDHPKELPGPIDDRIIAAARQALAKTTERLQRTQYFKEFLQLAEQQEKPPTPANGPNAKHNGRVTGMIQLAGDVPPVSPIVGRDTTNGASFDVPNETLLVSKERCLANAVVYLKKAPVGFVSAPPPSEPFVLTNEALRISPHVAVMRVGQPVLLKNADSQAADLRSSPIRNAVFNVVVKENDSFALNAGSIKVAEQSPFQVTSDLRTWKQAFVLPLDHPFAAVTDSAGRFEISGLPPGEHEFTVWHERVGDLEKKLKVVVSEGQTTVVPPLRYESVRFDSKEPTADVIVGPPPEVGLGQRQEKVVWSHDSRLVFAAGDFPTLTLWQYDEPRWMPTSLNVEHHANSITASRKSPLIVIGTTDGTAEVWDATTRKRRCELRSSPEYGVYAVAISSDDKWVAACGTDGTVAVFDLATQQLIARLGEKAATRMSSLAFSPDGQTLAAMDRYGRLVLWRLANRTQVAEWKGVAGEDCSVQWAADGQQLAVSGYGRVTLIAAEKGSQPRVVEAPEAVVSRYPKTNSPNQSGPDFGGGVSYASITAIASDLRSAASIMPNGSIGIWEIASRTIERRLPAPDDNVLVQDSAGKGLRHLTFSPDSRRLAATTFRGDVIFWQLAEGNAQVAVAQTPTALTPQANETALPKGLEFLKPYPKLHGLSLDMTEPQFLEIVKQRELKTRKTVEGEKVTHHVALCDGHTLIVKFGKDAKSSGIQRVQGEDKSGAARGTSDPTLDPNSDENTKQPSNANEAAAAQLNIKYEMPGAEAETRIYVERFDPTFQAKHGRREEFGSEEYGGVRFSRLKNGESLKLGGLPSGKFLVARYRLVDMVREGTSKALKTVILDPQWIDIAEHETKSISVSRPAGHAIAGRVVIPADRRVNTLVVHACSENVRGSGTLTHRHVRLFDALNADSDGKFKTEPLPPGRYKIVVEGYANHSLAVSGEIVPSWEGTAQVTVAESKEPATIEVALRELDRDAWMKDRLAAANELEFLKPYPKLHGLSLDMTEPQFLEIVKQQELKTRKSAEGEKVTHHIALGDGHTLIVMFDKEGKCTGIQRVRGEVNTVGHFNGRVIDPDGKPLSRARVFVAPWTENLKTIGAVRAETDAAGRFEFDAPDMTYTNAEGRVLRRQGMLIVTADGFAADGIRTWGNDLPGFRSHSDPIEGAALELRLAKSDVPIEGRFLNHDGTPLVGARVEIIGVMIPQRYDLAAHLAREVKFTVMNVTDYERELYKPGLLPGLVVETKTDAEGRFKLSGLGRDRLTYLKVSAPSVVDTELEVMTRDDPDVRTRLGGPIQSDTMIYGAKFTLQLKPRPEARAGLDPAVNQNAQADAVITAPELEKLIQAKGRELFFGRMELSQEFETLWPTKDQGLKTVTSKGTVRWLKNTRLTRIESDRMVPGPGTIELHPEQWTTGFDGVRSYSWDRVARTVSYGALRPGAVGYSPILLFWGRTAIAFPQPMFGPNPKITRTTRDGREEFHVLQELPEAKLAIRFYGIAPDRGYLPTLVETRINDRLDSAIAFGDFFQPRPGVWAPKTIDWIAYSKDNDAAGKPMIASRAKLTVTKLELGDDAKLQDDEFQLKLPLVEQPPQSQAAKPAPLDRKVPLNFRRAPLDEVLETLCRAADLKLELDTNGLKSEGYTRHAQVTAVDAEPVTLKMALAQVLKPFNKLAFLVDGDVLFVSSETQVEARRRKVAEDVSRRMEGEWELVELIVDGTKVEVAGQDMKVVVEDGHLTYFYGGKDKTKFAKFRIRSMDLGNPPSAIDLEVVNGLGRNRGQVLRGIYELTGDEFRICLPDKADIARPAKFESPVGSSRQLFRLRRVAAQPAPAEEKTDDGQA